MNLLRSSGTNICWLAPTDPPPTYLSPVQPVLLCWTNTEFVFVVIWLNTSSLGIFTMSAQHKLEK